MTMVASRAVLLDQAGLGDRLDEGAAGAVAAGGLGGVDLDDAVVHPQTGEGGHHVLDHLDDRLASLERRAALAGDDVADMGGHLRRAGQIDPSEDDAGLGRRGQEPEGDVGLRKESDSPDTGLPGDRLLFAPGGLHER